jgi:hypothetical protein
MLSIIIAVLIGAGAGTAVGIDLQSTPWGITCGLAGYVITQIIISLILRKKVNAVQAGIQEEMNADRERINRQLTTFQQRQPGNMTGLKQLADRLQNEVSHKLLAATDRFKVFYLWNPMLYKQINAMKVQLFYQLKDYDAVDRLLPKSMLIDPLSLSIKLVRMYRHEDKEIDAFYNKKCSKFKSDQGAFLACVYAWIKLKQQNSQAAIAALRGARKLSDNPVLIENLDKLVNDRKKDFSNAGFGDQWYALGLEEFKPKAVRRRNNGPMY